jgi:hypothetical protein
MSAQSLDKLLRNNAADFPDLTKLALQHQGAQQILLTHNAPIPAGLQPRKISRAPLRRLTVVKATAQLSRDEIQRQLQQKEHYLASLFESGKPMPRVRP